MSEQTTIPPTIPAGRLLKALSQRPMQKEDGRLELANEVSKRLEQQKRMVARLEHGAWMIAHDRDLDEVRLYLGM